MKKLSTLLLLLMLFMGGVISSAQTFTASDAPSNDQWSENTHWYTIKFKNQKTETSYRYWATDDNHVSSTGDILSKVVSGDTKADYLWCVVSDASVENGYKFYNLSDGTTKVLGFTIGSGDGGNDRAKMYDVDNIPSGVVTTLVYCPNNVSGTNSFKLNGTSNRYLNSRDPYIAVWTGDALNNCAGSSFTFEEVSADNASTLISSRYDELKNTASSVYTSEQNYAGQLFIHTTDALNKINEVCSAEKSTDFNTLSTTVGQVKTYLHDIALPEIGKKYALKNYVGGYLYMGHLTAYPDASVCMHFNDNLVSKDQVWTLEGDCTTALESNAIQIKNVYYNLYISGEKTWGGHFATANTGTSYHLIANDGNRYGTCAINRLNSGNSCLNKEVATNTLASWASEGNSSWYFEEISDDAYNALAEPSPAQDIVSDWGQAADYWRAKLPIVADAVTTAQTTYNNGKNLSNAQAYLKAVEDHSYYRFESEREITLNGENSVAYLSISGSNAHAYKKDLGDANQIWQVYYYNGVAKLRHPNTGKFMNPFNRNAASNAQTTLNDNVANGAAITFESVPTTSGSSTHGAGYYLIIDGRGSIADNKSAMNLESDGRITNWDACSGGHWKILQAKSIEIPLTTVGTKTYATAYLPFPISAVSGASAYIGTLNAERNYIDFTDVTSGFAAREGVVLEGDAGEASPKAVLTIGGTVEKKDNCFTGSCTPVSVAENERDNYRVLGVSTTDESHIAFFKPSAQLTTIGANRAYILNTNLSSLLNVRYGQIEGIGEVATSPDADRSNAPVYDLTGRRVMQTVKGGVYIQNGKKFIVK